MMSAARTFFWELAFLIGGLGLLVRDLWHGLTRLKIESKLWIDQIYQVGAKSFPLIFVTAASTGMVMTLQFGIGLEKFGGKPYVPKIVALSLLRELGPVFASLMMAARVGAGIASEIGSMVVTQQIDAIRALGTSPIQKIVIPRVLACFIALPILAAFANVIGILGAMVVGFAELDIDPSFFLLKVYENDIVDFVSGFVKTFFFALFIAVTACYYGLRVEEGTRGVGIATTKAVVAGSVMILIGDYFLTRAFWIVEQLL
ncbi:MAG: ABC transporter permease [Bdellovibrio sp.]